MKHIASIPVKSKEPMITIELTQDELQALAGFLDAGVKATGLQGVKHAAGILTKLEAAVALSNRSADKDDE